MSSPTTYSKVQIILHWFIAVLVSFQIVFHESIEEIWRARMTGAVPNEPSVNPHALVGIIIFVLMGWRLWLRVKRGVPALPEAENAILKFIAHATHVLFYALLIAMPISGSAAWFFGVSQAAKLHASAETLLIPLILLHIAAALAQHFWFKTNVLKRMVGRN